MPKKKSPNKALLYVGLAAAGIIALLLLLRRQSTANTPAPMSFPFGMPGSASGSSSGFNSTSAPAPLPVDTVGGGETPPPATSAKTLAGRPVPVTGVLTNPYPPGAKNDWSTGFTPSPPGIVRLPPSPPGLTAYPVSVHPYADRAAKAIEIGP